MAPTGNVYVANAGASGYVAVFNTNLQRTGTLTGVAAPTSVAVDRRSRRASMAIRIETAYRIMASRQVPLRR